VLEHGGLDTIRYWIGPNLHFISIRCAGANCITRSLSSRATATAQAWTTRAPRTSWKRILPGHTRA
jgi:hypothetical protein